MDLEDETWCLYDGELIDDELAELWAHFAKGVRIVVLSDSCHSGTATKMRQVQRTGCDGSGPAHSLKGSGRQTARFSRHA